jgi:hypothetical protein
MSQAAVRYDPRAGKFIDSDIAAKNSTYFSVGEGETTGVRALDHRIHKNACKNMASAYSSSITMHIIVYIYFHRK